MNFKSERYTKHNLTAWGCWILFLIVLIGFLTAWVVEGQGCYPGFVPTADDPDCDGVISIGIPLAVNVAEGTDGLFYLQCMSGCAEFYAIAPIDVLYTGYPTGLVALETWRKLLYDYYGWDYVPLP